MIKAEPFHHRKHFCPHAWGHNSVTHERPFPNLDGIRFLTHQLGCGGTRQDAQALCALLAGYIHHPNVAGATVLSLGCQNRAIGPAVRAAARTRSRRSASRCCIFDQQKSGTEAALMEKALDQTIAALAEANRVERAPAPLSALTVGLQCGGSDGFSGISANPTVGYVSDLVGGCRRQDHSLGISRVARRGAGTHQPLRHGSTRRALCPPHAGLCGARPRRAIGLRLQSLARQHPRRPHHRRHQIRRRGAQGRRLAGQRRHRLSRICEDPRPHAAVHTWQRCGERDGAGWRGFQRLCSLPPA